MEKLWHRKDKQHEVTQFVKSTPGSSQNLHLLIIKTVFFLVIYLYCKRYNFFFLKTVNKGRDLEKNYLNV